ncbi:MFS transporter [Acidisphaera sp. S103]|uniref:MFS transporter n=1 Tax=Acidisphaera sp. S103 TaxID=1747223 RepID=UPI00131AE5B3|nr:MFS transporter [Acidisphaera sp. S103]
MPTSLSAQAASTAATLRPTNRRFRIMGLLFITIVINYLDRSNISIAAPSLTAEFHLDPVQLGLVFSAFSWTYTTFQLPGGWLVDRVHPRVLYPVVIMLWSLATLSLGLANGLVALIALRMAVGFFEVPTFLINNRIATTWFGEKERATCIAVYTAAESVGLAFLTPILFWIKTEFGWPSIFLVTGMLGLGWSFAFSRVYRDPADTKGINAAEIHQIAESGGIPDLSQRVADRRKATTTTPWRDLRIVLGRRKLWGIYFGHFVWGTVGTFFYSWFPTYLVTYRHFTFIKAGFYVSLPFLAVFLGVLCSGALSDLLVRKGFSLTFARKAPIIGGLVCATSIVGANYVDSEPLIMLFLTFAFFCNGVASIHWSLVSATAPERLIGLTSSVFNCMGGVAGIMSPIVIGFLLRSGDFRLPLIFIAVIEALGVCSYIFVVGKLERVRE